MSFRTRLFIAFAAAVVIPLATLAFGVRREMSHRLSAEYQRRVRGAVAAIREDLTRQRDNIATRLAVLSDQLSRDNRFRLAALDGDPATRRFLLDYAGTAMRLSGLSFLQVQDTTGRIMSSGHFRNEYDQRQPELSRFLFDAAEVPALVRARTPEAALLTLARIETFSVGGNSFTLAGGVELDEGWLRMLSRDPDLSVALVLPGSEPATDTRDVVEALPVAFLDLLPDTRAQPDTAYLVVTQSARTLAALRRRVDAWSLAALAVTSALALSGVAWLSARVSRPLRELAEKTEKIDLDRLDQDFASDRPDEIGALSRLLGAMTERLRVGAGRLREAERRVAMGDLARQVNHDIKNGLGPIRHVLRHLDQVAGERPERLAAVYQERKGTLESSVGYLESLARNYARLSPEIGREPCDLNEVVLAVAGSARRPDPGTMRLALAESLPPVAADRLVARRIVENLVGNAVDSLAGLPEAAVTLTTEAARGDDGGTLVRLTVADTGPGMTRSELDRAFDAFYTTKPGGTGLGLPIVRRLVLDLDGALRVDTEPGAGTRVTVELPASPALKER